MSSLGAWNVVRICSFPPLICYHSKSSLTWFSSSCRHTLTLERCQLNLNIVVLHCAIVCASQYIVDPLSIPIAWYWHVNKNDIPSLLVLGHHYCKEGRCWDEGVENMHLNTYSVCPDMVDRSAQHVTWSNCLIGNCSANCPFGNTDMEIAGCTYALQFTSLTGHNVHSLLTEGPYDLPYYIPYVL